MDPSIIDTKAAAVAAAGPQDRETMARKIRRSCSRLEAAYLTPSQIEIQTRRGLTPEVREAMVDMRSRIIRQEQEDGFEEGDLAWMYLRCGVSAGRLLCADPKALVESLRAGDPPFISVHRLQQLQRVATRLSEGQILHGVSLSPEYRELAREDAEDASGLLRQVEDAYLRYHAGVDRQLVLDLIEPLSAQPEWLVRTLTR